jgi:hypothetical protein
LPLRLESLLPAFSSVEPLRPTPDAPPGLAIGQPTGAERPELRSGETSPLGQRRALEGEEQTPGESHLDTCTADSALEQQLDQQGDDDEAETLGCRALEGREETLGPSLADALQERMGKLDEALPLHRRLVEGQKQTLGASHANTLDTVATLASELEAQGKLDEALPLYRRLLYRRPTCTVICHSCRRSTSSARSQRCSRLGAAAWPHRRCACPCECVLLSVCLTLLRSDARLLSLHCAPSFTTQRK